MGLLRFISYAELRRLLFFFLGGGGGGAEINKGELLGVNHFWWTCLGGKVLIKAFKGLYSNKNGLFRVVFRPLGLFLGSSFDWLIALF